MQIPIARDRAVWVGKQERNGRFLSISPDGYEQAERCVCRIDHLLVAAKAVCPARRPPTRFPTKTNRS